MADRVGRYILEERVARGGMAEVWRALDPERGEDVCLKRLDPSLRNDVDFIEMFRDEAALVLDLDHDNVVKVIELIDADDELAQVMEFVDGPSLARIRAGVEQLEETTGAGGFTAGEALQISIYLARALHHAHTRRRDGRADGAPLMIVHRDVSPQNVLIDKQGRLKLVDFGVAKAAQRLTTTRAGTLKGKLSYMAPEQARGSAVDHRADQFAAAVLLWEMLTGRRLFTGRNELLILDQVTKSDPVPPSTVKAGIPRAVDRVVLRALRWHAEERFPDMAAFERALQACLDELEPKGKVELASLVARALAAGLPVVEGAAHTRVMAQADDSTKEASAEAPRPFTTNPTAQPEHTGQFFKPRAASWPMIAGVGGLALGLIGGGVALAVWLAERDVAPPPPALSPLEAELAAIERTLEGAPSHPCRTELLDDLLDPAPFSDAGRAALATSATQCRALADDAARLRTRADKLEAAYQTDQEALADPKNKKKKKPSLYARVAQLERLGRASLDAGAYERAKMHLAEAVALAPARLELQPLLAQTFRGLGDPAGAAYHVRLWLHAQPDDANGERARRYLARYGQSAELVPSSRPAPDEQWARLRRLRKDAEQAPPAERPVLLERAHALLPRDSDTLLALVDAYEAIGQAADARAVLEAALAMKPPPDNVKKLRARRARLGG
ncbi:MAG: protein kinase [Deltaproteobacteria bacterium]|nr:protein kinase [Deltaproteobacteria bacterium]